MTRREQIEEAWRWRKNDKSRIQSIHSGFIDGALWADQNPIDPNDIIIQLIHQRSIAFDEARDARDKLAIAVEALEKCPCGEVCKNNCTSRIALAKIQETKK